VKSADTSHEASGFVLLDKPAGMTSFQLLFPLKRTFNTKRVGHAGTLDQEATGLMVAAVGKCTRLLDRIESQSKMYSFRLHLGRTTDTLEFRGEVLSEDPNGARSTAQLQTVLGTFLGVQQQKPPQYSAIKIEGKRASDLMRKGQEVELKPRQIEIMRLELQAVPESSIEDVSCQEFDLVCACSKGTYIRALGRDIAVALGTVGSVSLIRRLAIGSLMVEQGQSIKDPETLQLIAPEVVFHWPRFDLTEARLGDVRQGKRVSVSLDDSSSVFAMAEGRAVAMGRVESSVFFPELQLNGV